MRLVFSVAPLFNIIVTIINLQVLNLAILLLLCFQLLNLTPTKYFLSRLQYREILGPCWPFSTPAFLSCYHYFKLELYPLEL